MQKSNLALLLFFSFYFQISLCKEMRLTRVILAVNEKQEYLNFWPVAAKSWKQLIGVIPTLALIADESIEIDETLGEVIRIPPIENISTVYMSQTIRLLLPALFPDDVCIVSDIDHIAVNGNYFHNKIIGIDEEYFVIYREFSKDVVEFHKKMGLNPNMWPMCYVAAKGSVFAEIFNVEVNSLEAIRAKLIEWSEKEIKQWGWSADQMLLYTNVVSWKNYPSKVYQIRDNWIFGRIHPYDWARGRGRIKSRSCIDIAGIKPFSKYKDLIEEAMNLLGLK